ncbi:TorF family putative porin [Brevundimonas pishanensis]|uniref:TorF family putative porin n=1 Tax=Brevundimonas pishanensis TaxID=2896315 RepID=UPI001FA7E4AE|nr:TorF family putative porin [Brevundimonas pishanensis]
MRLNALRLPLALLAASLALPAAAHAQSWDVTLGAGTDNRSKDASKSNGEAFVSGEAQWNSADGFFYAGPAFETVKSNGSNIEVEIGGGIRPQWAGFDFDLNAVHKWRLDSNPGVDDDAWEFTADMKRSIGPASARLRLQHSPDGTGSVKQWTWVSARAGWDFNDKLNASAELGYRDQTNAVSYTGYNVGVSYLLTQELELDVRWHGTDADEPGEQYKDALVATVAYMF